MCEVRYRASRICRVLGNPTAYELLHVLKKRKKSPEQLAHILGVSIATVSVVLRILRNLDLVRYEVKWRSRYYWIKTNAVNSVMADLEKLVKIIETLR